MKLVKLLFLLVILSMTIVASGCLRVEGRKYTYTNPGNCSCQWACSLLFHENFVEFCPPNGNQYPYTQNGNTISISQYGNSIDFTLDANGNLTRNGCTCFEPE